MKKESHLLVACLVLSVFASVLAQVGIAYASRNASGTYSLPSGNPVVSGTAISSTVHNTTLSDIGSEITDSLSRSGEGAMLEPLKAAVGDVSLPGYTFSGDTNTGLYWVSADVIGVATGGVLQASVTSTGLRIGASGHAIADSYAATASLDFAGVTDSCESLTIAITGAAVNDTCSLGSNASPSASSWFYCYVSSADVVTVRHCAHGASGNPAAASFSVRTFDPE
jgi:hypothetical protein